MCPNIVEHDDEEVDIYYFHEKTQVTQQLEPFKIDLLELDMFKIFKNFGLSTETVRLMV